MLQSLRLSEQHLEATGGTLHARTSWDGQESKAAVLNLNGSWGDSPAADTGCSSEDPHGNSQPSVTLVPEDPIPSSGLHGPWAHLWCAHTYTDKTPVHIKSIVQC